MTPLERAAAKTTPRGFEALRAEPNGFLVHLLDRSDTVSMIFGRRQTFSTTKQISIRLARTSREANRRDS